VEANNKSGGEGGVGRPVRHKNPPRDFNISSLVTL